MIAGACRVIFAVLPRERNLEEKQAIEPTKNRNAQDCARGSTTWRLPQVTASVCHWRAGTRRPGSGPPRGVRIGRATARDQMKGGPDARCVRPLILDPALRALGSTALLRHLTPDFTARIGCRVDVDVE